ncbi:MAG: T9SS type A sorting domain-containing protein [Bacteroidetes bacterium]|nr:T9SS type A sorting domain-containing protein [Bacteroidota bacterium]
MKKQLLKKLSVFIIMAMMFSASANAQIMYTDINPDIKDTIIATGIIDSIDINNDGIFDLRFSGNRTYSGSWGPAPTTVTYSVSLKVTPLNGSEIKTNSTGFPLKMDQNDTINSGGNWNNAAGQILCSRSTSAGPLGNWSGFTNAYLGVKIISGGQTHYCWVRMGVTVTMRGSSFITTIKDYAYNSISNQPILAGEMGAVPSGIMESSLASSILLFPNPASRHVTIDLGKYNQHTNLTITDINGKIVYATTENATQQIVVNTTAFNEGIYFVRIQSENFTEVKKLMVRK